MGRQTLVQSIGLVLGALDFLLLGPGLIQWTKFCLSIPVLIHLCQQIGLLAYCVRMKLLASIIALAGYSTARTAPAAIQVGNFQRIHVDVDIGGAVEIVFRATNKGVIDVRLHDSELDQAFRDTILHISIRLSESILILQNPYEGEKRPSGFPFPSPGNIETITLRIEMRKYAFDLFANGKKIAYFETWPSFNQIQYDEDDEAEGAELLSISVEF